MKKLIIAINNHKRSGKSSFIRVYSELLSRNGLDFTNLHTSDHDALDKSLLWEVDETPDQELLLANVENNDVVMIDVASDHADHLTDFFENSDTFEALAELDAEITVVMPNCPDIDMSSELVGLGEYFSDEANFVIVHQSTVTEDHWTGSHGEKAMEYMGAIDIDVPELNEAFSSQLKNEYNITLPEALLRRKELPRFLRDELHRWELSYSANLEEAADVLIPDEKVSKSAYGSRFATALKD